MCRTFTNQERRKTVGLYCFNNYFKIEVQAAKVGCASKLFFLNAGRAGLQIGLFPLLKEEIQAREITAKNVALSQVSDGQGDNQFQPA